MGKNGGSEEEASEGASGSDAEGGDVPEDLHWTLVEYVRGIKGQKWKLELGKPYTVGRNGSDVAQIEVHHASLSRKHCSLAMTLVESEPILVVLDHGSANGTFVNKSRLEKEVGLKISLNELKYMAFGECPNGYRIVANDAGAQSSKEAAAAKEGAAGKKGADKAMGEDEWRRKAEAAKRMAAEARKPRQEAGGRSADGQKQPSTAPRKRGAWRTEDAESYVKRRARAAKPGEAAPEAGEIEWPEDWK